LTITLELYDLVPAISNSSNYVNGNNNNKEDNNTQSIKGQQKSMSKQKILKFFGFFSYYEKI